jgi:hypothetical protein
MGLREIQRGGVGWMHVEQNRHQWRDHVNTVVMSLCVLQKAADFLTDSETI